MKKLTLFILILFIVQVSFGQDPVWLQQNSTLTDNLVSISVIDEQNVWIASASGTLLFTDDGGTTWQVQQTFPQHHLESIIFTNSQHACLVGWSGEVMDSTIVLITNDGGQSWQSKEHPSANYFYDVFFINGNRGWVVGRSGIVGWIIFTDDGGETWVRQMDQFGIASDLYGVHFRDEEIGQICGSGGTFLITNNAGTLGNGWAVNISIPSLGKDLYGMMDYGAMDGWIVGEQGLILGTIDNWTNYYEPASGTENNLNAVGGDVTDNKFWAVGDAGTILYKAGFLVGWEQQVSGITENLNDVGFANSSIGWAVGDNGKILKYAVSGAGVGEHENYLLSVYPMPCTDKVTIRYLIPDARCQMIEIYNISGKRILELECPAKKGGVYETGIDVSDLPSGIYFVRMGSGNKIMVQKIVKVG